MILLAPTGSIVWFGCNTTMENDSLLLHNEKVEISQYTKQGFPYVIGKTPKSFPFSAPKDKAVRRRKTRTIKAAVTGFPLFLAELVVSGIGKVEKLQYYLIPGLLPARATGFPLFSSGMRNLLSFYCRIFCYIKYRWR